MWTGLYTIITSSCEVLSICIWIGLNVAGTGPCEIINICMWKCIIVASICLKSLCSVSGFSS